jgi:arylsulfatase A-like enzyme
VPEVKGDGGNDPAAPELRPVFSFVDNRPLAHVHKDGALWISAGTAGFAKYLRHARPAQPWQLAQVVDGRAVAILDRRGRFEVPEALAAADVDQVLSLGVSVTAKRRLTVRVNGQALARADLVPGWQVASLAVPKAALAARQAGADHQVEIDGGGGKALAIEWLALGDQAVAAESAAKPEVLPWSPGAIAPGGGSELSWIMWIPEDAHVVADVPGGCEVTVRARDDQGRSASGTLASPGARVALGAVAGSVAEVTLGARPRAGASCPAATLAKAALAVAVPGAGVVARAPVPSPKRPKNVVFWIMDTLRYDRVALWNPGALAEVPHLAELARTGALFKTFYPGGNESLVSHASLFSGLLPVLHRIIGRDGFGWKFDKDWVTLGEIARAAGQYVAGVTANGHVVKDAGYGHGFHAYENPMASGLMDKDNGYAGEKVLARAVELVAKHRDQPFFMFVGTIDTHVPYRAHEPWVSTYDAPNGPYKGPFLKSATAGGINVSFMLSRKRPARRDEKRLFANYASSVSYQDHLVGQLIAELRAWGVLDDTMIIVAGDHGEEFWEHGIAGHGGSLREVVVHTPFLVWYPPLVPAAVIDEGVEGIDVLPTVADALGAPIPDGAQGESLIALASGDGRGYPRPAIASHWEAAWAMRLGRWKLVVENDGDARLYDLAGDPEERTPVVDRPLARRFVADAFSLVRVYERRWKKRELGVGSNLRPGAAEVLERP